MKTKPAFRFVSLLFCLLLLPGLAACGQKDPRGEGSVVNGQYVNDALGLTFTAPEGWNLSDRAGIAGDLGLSSDDPSIERIEFAASSTTDLSSVELALIPFTPEGKDALDEYVTGFVDSLSAASGQGGVLYTCGERVPVSIAGREYVRVNVLRSVAGFETMSYYYFAYLKKPAVIVNIIAVTGDETHPGMIEGFFSK